MTETPVVNSGFLLGMTASVVFVVAYPLVLAVVAHRRLHVGWRYLAYGAIVFFVFQLATRVPAVSLIQSAIAEQLKSSPTLMWAWPVLLAPTAGLFEEILHLTADIGADVIVMRTHARVGVERAVFGSVAEHVLKGCQVPLIVLRPGGRRVTRIQRLVVPADGSPADLIALEAAEAAAEATGASIDIVQVAVTIPTFAYAAPCDWAGAAYYDPTWDENTVIAAGAYVSTIAERLRANGHSVESEARVAASAPEGIVAAAAARQSDLIVMSTHALTGPKRTILGSVADAVVRSAPCPVLLVKTANNSVGEHVC
jgi:nucleotide-binding universal stress UspA family protein